MMKDAIATLAYFGHVVAKHKALLAEKEEQLHATPEWEQVERARENLRKASAKEAVTGIEAREQAMRIFTKTNNRMPHPAVKVKMYTVLEYRDEDAINYAREHLPGALKLDKRVFKKAALAVAMDFVAILQEPRATIARDLSKYLPPAGNEVREDE